MRLLAGAIPYLAVLIGLYGFSNIWIAMGLYHAGVLVFLLTRRPGPGWSQLLRGWQAKPAAMLLLAGTLSGLVIYLVFPTANGSAVPLSDSLSRFGVRAEHWILLFVYYVAVTPWLEELFWRGHLGGDSRSPALSDVLFAGYHVLVLVRFLHVPWVLLSFAVLLAVAWMWRQVRRSSGGLLVPVLSHLVADASTMLAVHGLIR